MISLDQLDKQLKAMKLKLHERNKIIAMARAFGIGCAAEYRFISESELAMRTDICREELRKYGVWD